MRKLIITALGVCLLQTLVYAQDRPMRIGVKIGVPNLAGLNFEYVTPWLNGRLAPTLDVSFIPINFIEPSYATATYNARYNYSYFELGANYYFFKEGKGLYGNVSYGRMGLDFTFTDYYSEDSPYNSPGVVDSKINANLVNLKIGAKLGNGFYFRPEIGIAAIGLPKNLSYTVVYPDGTTERETEDLSDIIGGTLVVNIGFGVAF